MQLFEDFAICTGCLFEDQSSNSRFFFARGAISSLLTFVLNDFQFAPVTGAGNPDDRTHFIYYDEPIITSVLPSGGPDEGGTEITLIGSGFKNFTDKNYPPKCKFGTQTSDSLIFSDNMVK